MSQTTHRDGRPKRPRPYAVQMRDALANVPALAMPHAHRLVLTHLALYAHPDGTRCFPGASTVRASCGMGERLWFRVLRELEAARWLAREHRKRPGIGGQTSNGYTLRLNGGPIVSTSPKTGTGADLGAHNVVLPTTKH